MYNTKPKSAKYEYDTSPPFVSPVQTLMDVINNRADAGNKRPAMMPAHPQQAAEWWISLQEPAGDDEQPRLAWTKAKPNESSKQYWIVPYSQRLSETLKRFYKLSHGDQMKIIDWHEQGIWWRGDSIEFMEARANVKDVDPKQVLGMMRAIIGGMSNA